MYADVCLGPTCIQTDYQKGDLDWYSDVDYFDAADSVDRDSLRQ